MRARDSFRTRPDRPVDGARLPASGWVAVDLDRLRRARGPLPDRPRPPAFSAILGSFPAPGAAPPRGGEDRRGRAEIVRRSRRRSLVWALLLVILVGQFFGDRLWPPRVIVVPEPASDRTRIALADEA